MGLGIEAIRKTFPRSAQAMEQYQRLIDQTFMDPVDRSRLKSGVTALVIVVAEEASEIRKTIGDVKSGLGLVRNIFANRKK